VRRSFASVPAGDGPPVTRSIVLTPQINGADGISAVARLATRALVSAGELPEVWSLHDAAADLDLGRDVQFRTARGSRTRFVAWVAARAVSGTVPSHVLALHVHLLPAAMPLANRGSRVAVYLHGIEVWQPLPRKLRWALRRADAVLANSSYTARRFVEANPHFADLGIAICPPALATDWSAEPRVPPTNRPPIALIVGRMSSAERYKGHDRLIDIWPSVMAQAPGATLLVIGDGDDRARLESRARERGLTSAVQFRGAVAQADLRDAYATARVFVMPSSGEGFGIVYLEAMAAGLPCIGAPGAAEEIIEHGRTGFIVPEDPADRLVEALVCLLCDGERADTMGRLGAARVDAVFPERRFQMALAAGLGLSTPVKC
jgi:phosphatidylinositol alpha-1,6-mannosyltransferase